jgi:hypothetical protein
MGLGPAHTVSLAGARERARAARQMLLDGKDPIEAKRAALTARRVAAAKLVMLRGVPSRIPASADMDQRGASQAMGRHA